MATPLKHKLACWVEAMRLRTLPVSVAGVFAAVGCAMKFGPVKWLPAVLCLAFAVLAQISSNFANEYFDFRAGLDRPGRVGPRRGVTEGDITPRAMLIATILCLGLACAIGCSLIIWGGWWLVPVGLFIAIGVMAYSAGPYPLSRHGLGEVSVFFFFGIIPVVFTCYIVAGHFLRESFATGAAIGLMGANVLIVNNYRDCDDDAKVGKHTLAVLFGRASVSWLYLANGIVAMALMAVWLLRLSIWWTVPVLVYLACHLALYRALVSRTGSALNPLLGMTSVLMFLFALALIF